MPRKEIEKYATRLIQQARGALEPNLNARDHAALLLRWMVVSVRASLPLLQRADINLPKDFLKKRRTIAGSRT